MPDIPVTVSPVTLAPLNFQASANGTVVSISFQAPTGGPPIGYYAVDGARNPSFNPASFTVIVPAAGTYSGSLAPGTYYLRVRSVSPGGAPGLASETRMVQVGAPVEPPAPPTLTPVNVTSNPITLSWAPGGGGAALGYTLVAGTSPGASNLGTFPMGAATSITATVPLGVRIHVRVVASNAAGQATSNEIDFQVAPPLPPGAPVMRAPSVSGSAVTLSWTPPAGGGTPTGYVVRARATPGGAIIATLPVSGTSVTVQAPAGRYYVDVVGVNGAGQGAASNSVTVVVP
jgi:hypothetical protein